MKIVIFCSSCEAECIIKHDLEEPYIIGFCPFCGEELDNDMEDEVEYDEEEYE